MYLHANVGFGRCMGSNLQRKGRAEGITQLLTFQHLVGIVRTTCNNIFFSVALRLNAGHGLLILEFSKSHTTTYHSR